MGLILVAETGVIEKETKQQTQRLRGRTTIATVALATSVILFIVFATRPHQIKKELKNEKHEPSRI